MWILLIKRYRLYIRKFKSFPDLYKQSIIKCIDKYELNVNKDNLDRELLRINLKKTEKEIIFKSIKKKASKLGVEIGDEFIQMRNLISSKAYKEDHIIFRYFSNIGWFRQKFDDKCKFCGKDNSREHAVNECHKFKDDIEEMKEKLKVYDNRSSQKRLTEIG